MKLTLKAFCLPLIVPALFLCLWEFIAVRLNNDIILPAVGQVGALLLHPFEDLISMRSLLDNVGISKIRVVTG